MVILVCVLKKKKVFASYYCTNTSESINRRPFVQTYLAIKHSYQFDYLFSHNWCMQLFITGFPRIQSGERPGLKPWGARTSNLTTQQYSAAATSLQLILTELGKLFVWRIVSVLRYLHPPQNIWKKCVCVSYLKLLRYLSENMHYLGCIKEPKSIFRINLEWEITWCGTGWLCLVYLKMFCAFDNSPFLFIQGAS